MYWEYPGALVQHVLNFRTMKTSQLNHLESYQKESCDQWKTALQCQKSDLKNECWNQEVTGLVGDLMTPCHGLCHWWVGHCNREK